MDEMDPALQLPLEPLSYHVEMIRHLQSQEADLWKWFAADRFRAEENEAVRMDLLKSTYRVERDASPALYLAADEVAATLGFSVPTTFYQSPSAGGLNAALAYMPGEAHIILSGPITTTLTPVELRCVIGHELAHFGLLDRWREYLIAAQILAAMTNDPQAEICHIASTRLFDLYTEVYCDHGAYQATGDLAATISSLVKIETGSADISADSYLRQTEEIFSKGHPRTEGVTHPETFIRAKAMTLWVDQPDAAATEIKDVIEGPLALSELDLLGQQRLMITTRRLISAFLRPRWLRTERNLAHARFFFDDFLPASAEDDALAGDLKEGDEKVRDYYCYVMIDFAVADRELEDASLAAALLLSDDLGLGERFRQLAVKELNLRKRQLAALEADASRIVARAAEAGEEE